MPNVKATADVSVWNNIFFDTDVAHVSDENASGTECHQVNDSYLSVGKYNYARNTVCGALKTACNRTYKKTFCIAPNEDHNVINKDARTKNKKNGIKGKPCPHATSAKFKDKTRQNQIDGSNNPYWDKHVNTIRDNREHGQELESKLSCTYDSLSSANLVEFSKNENYNKHSRQGKDGKTLYQQLVKQYCQDYRNLFEVVEGNDNKTCLQLSNNPHSSKTLGEDLAHLENMITEEQKQQFCNEYPSYEWCAVWNLLKKDKDKMFCEKDANSEYPGCKEYKKRLDTIYEKNKDQYNVVKEVGKQLPHCAVPEVWATDKDNYMPTNKTEVLKSCPSTVLCLIANNFTDANMQNTSFYNNATCNTEVNNNVTLVDGAGDSEASASSTNIFTQASPSGAGSYSGSNTGTVNSSVQSSSSSSNSTSPPEQEKTNWLVIILAIVSMFGCMFASIALASVALGGGGGGGGGGD